MRKNNLGVIKEDVAGARRIATFALVLGILALGIASSTLFLVLS